MAVTRVKNLAKLLLLLGVPVVILVGLFSCGVYVGHENREAVLKFERDWLGFAVTVPGEPVKTEPGKTEPVKTEPGKTEPVKTEPGKTEPVKTEPVKPEPTVPVVPAQPEPVVLTKAEEPLPFPMPEPAPLNQDNRIKLEDPARIAVKVLVDPALAARRPDWLAYVQRHIAWSSLVLDKQIGLHVDVHGIVKMEATPRGLADVAEHPREGANLLLVFVDEEFHGPIAAEAAADSNLDVMIVQAVGRSRSAHLRGLLLALGQVFGARPLGEHDAETAQGSWMGAVKVDDSRPIKLDAANRMTMLAHKAYSFAPPVGVAAAEQDVQKEDPEPRPGQPALPSVQDKDPEEEETL